MKKLLSLGGSKKQIIAIKKAKELGYYTIVCDYLLDNPGKHYADKFYLESIINKEKILEIAKKEKIDGIIGYASDFAAPTVAYVANQLNLPGQPYDSVEILCNKDQFRNFLHKNKFNCPLAKSYTEINEAIKDFENNFFNFPVIIKPIDSCGSRGVYKINNITEFANKIENVLVYSRKKKFIVEEFIEKEGFQIAGDAFSINGKLEFVCFGDEYFNTQDSCSFVPIAASFPTQLSKEIQDKIKSTIQKIIDLLKLNTTSYNFDIILDKNQNVYVIEFSPRNGGNYIPQVIKGWTGIDLVELAIKSAMGEKIENIKINNNNEIWIYYVLHSFKRGIFGGIEISKDIIKNNVVELIINKEVGQMVEKYTFCNENLGHLIMKFKTFEEMFNVINNKNNDINIILEES